MQANCLGMPAAPLVCHGSDWKYWNNLSSSASGLGQLVVYNAGDGQGCFLPLPQELQDDDGDLRGLHKTHKAIGVQTYLAPYRKNVRGAVVIASHCLIESLHRVLIAVPFLVIQKRLLV